MITEVRTQDDLIAALKERSELAVRAGSGSSIEQLRVLNVEIENITFSDLHIANVHFTGCKFHRVHFDRCTLDHLLLRQSISHPFDLSELVECTFTNSTIYLLGTNACASVDTQVRNSIVVCSGLRHLDFIDCMILDSIISSDRNSGYPALNHCILADCTRNTVGGEDPPTGFLPSPFIGSALMVAAGHDHHLNSPLVLSQYLDKALSKIYAIAYDGVFLAGNWMPLIASSDPKKVDLGKWTSHIRKTLTRIIKKSDPESFGPEYEQIFSLIPEHLRASFVETVISVLVQQLTMFESISLGAQR